MKVIKLDFVNRVLLIMNENSLSDKGLSLIGADSTQADRIIEGSWVDSWRRCVHVMPKEWFQNKSFKTTIGVIDTFTLLDQAGTGNAGFAVNDLLYINSQKGEKAFFKVETINAAHEVTSISLVTSGAGFLVATYDATVYSGGGDIIGDFFIQIDSTKSVVNNPVANLADGTGYILLPEDFYLLTSFKMQGWRKSVYEVAIENDRVENIQSNDYTRGSTIRPVCTLKNKDIDGTISPIMKYYSLKKGLASHTVEEAIYIPIVKKLSEYEDEEELPISDQLYEPLAYLSAAGVYTMYEKYEIAKALEMKAIEMFPGLKTVKGENVTVKQ